MECVYADDLKTGDRYSPLHFRVNPELNERYCAALDDQHPRYSNIVHPGLFFCFSSITQSPSFMLPDHVAAVGARFDTEYVSPGKVGDDFRVEWEVVETYYKRSRLYQICEVVLRNSKNSIIFKRKINNTFVGGTHLQRRVQWEKETNYRKRFQKSEFPEQGYEISGKKIDITIQKMMLFSGKSLNSDQMLRNIHTDREVAIRSGLGRPVASGLMYEAYLVQLMVDFFGEKWFENGKMDIVIIDAAGDGDILTAKSVVTGGDFFNSRDEIMMYLWCENQYGSSIVVGGSSMSG